MNFFDTPKLMVVFHSTMSMLVFQLKNSLKITPKKFALDLQVMQLFLNRNESEFGWACMVFGCQKTI